MKRRVEIITLWQKNIRYNIAQLERNSVFEHLVRSSKKE
jgi:hypothetical protein